VAPGIHQIDDVLVPTLQQADNIFGGSQVGGSRGVVSEHKVELVTQLVALAFVASLDVEED
jgi:hypothetical protein